MHDSKTHNNSFFYLDVILSFLLFFTLLGLSIGKVIALRYSIWLAVGFVLGLIWETVHATIPGFLIVPGVTGNSVKMSFYVLAHSFWDSLILFGSAMVALALGLNIRGWCALLVILIIGLGIEFIVEFVCNGHIWTYATHHPGNPVLFKIRNVSYTMWALLEWLIAGLLYWLILRYIPQFP